MIPDRLRALVCNEDDSIIFGVGPGVDPVIDLRIQQAHMYVARKYRKFAIVDLEATCVKGDREAQALLGQETIELPAVVLTCDDRGRWLPGSLEFRTFVLPTRNPRLSEFCTSLTGIEQHQVDDAPTLDVALADFDRWLADNDVTAENALFVSCGDFDLRHLREEAQRASVVPGPTLGRMWDQFCNIKIPFVEHLKRAAVEKGLPAKEIRKIRRRDMAEMLEALGLELVGRHHSGIDDARNIARIASVLGADALRPTGSFDALGRFVKLHC